MSTTSYRTVSFLRNTPGFFYDDADLIKRNLEKADFLMNEGGDWVRRNRLKVETQLQASIIMLEILFVFCGF